MKGVEALVSGFEEMSAATVRNVDKAACRPRAAEKIKADGTCAH